MIRSARQLKDKIRNLARDKSADAQLLLRNYMMERFLDRVASSAYSEKFILKGGMLVTSMVGFHARSTMDIDTTMTGETLSRDEVQRIIGEVVAIDLSDGISFTVTGIDDIMDEAEYPGIRVSMNAYLEAVRVPLKVDISTGDVITPHAVEYSYKLMFEDRSIRLLAYNLETVLAEKLETIIARTTANTRMRDFYDIHILLELYRAEINPDTLSEALTATSRKRGTSELMDSAEKVLTELHDDKEMQALWETYRSKFSYAADISWNTALRSVRQAALSAGLQVNKPSVLEALKEPLPERSQTTRHKEDLER